MAASRELKSLASTLTIVAFLLGLSSNFIKCSQAPHDSRVNRFVNWINKGFMFEDFNQLADFKADFYNLNIDTDKAIVKWRTSPEVSPYFENISVFSKVERFLLKRRICFRDNIVKIREFVEEFELGPFMRDRSATEITEKPKTNRQVLAFSLAPVIKIYLYLVADKCFDVLKTKKRLEKADNDLNMADALKTFKQFIQTPDNDMKDCGKQQKVEVDSKNCLSTEVIDLNTESGRARYGKKLSNFLDFFLPSYQKNKDLCTRITKEVLDLVHGQQRQITLNWKHLTDTCVNLERWYKNTIDPISVSLSMTAIESQQKYLELLRDNPHSSLKKWSEISAWCNIILRTEVNVKTKGLKTEKEIKVHAEQLNTDDNNEYLAYVWNDSLKYLSMGSFMKSLFFCTFSGLAVTTGLFAIATGGAGLAITALVSGASAVVVSVTSSPAVENVQKWCN